MQLRNLFRKKKAPTTLNELGVMLASLSDEDKQNLASALNAAVKPSVVGDGHAEFLEPMTESEYATWMHEHEHGWKKVYDYLLGKSDDLDEGFSKNENGDS